MNDRRLRELFAGLRRADRLRTPEFTTIVGRPRRAESPARALRLAVAAAAVVAAAAALLLMTGRERLEPRVPSFSAATSWQAPTDFLLDHPGRALFAEPPGFGAEASAMPELGDIDRQPTAGPAGVRPSPRGGES